MILKSVNKLKNRIKETKIIKKNKNEYFLLLIIISILYNKLILYEYN